MFFILIYYIISYGFVQKIFLAFNHTFKKEALFGFRLAIEMMAVIGTTTWQQCSGICGMP
jgi:hypothetical protein